MNVSANGWRGAVVIYVGVGALSIDEAEKYVAKQKTELCEFVKNAKANGYDVLFFMRRDGETKVELLKM